MKPDIKPQAIWFQTYFSPQVLFLLGTNPADIDIRSRSACLHHKATATQLASATALKICSNLKQYPKQ